jgi:hypothetical protein
MQVEVKKLVSDQFSRTLMGLRGILKKAQTHAQEKKFDENLFLQLRVAPDMFPLVRQVQIATDTAKGATARLSGREIPVYADTETTLEELIARVDKTIEFVRSAKSEEFKNFASQKFTSPRRPGLFMPGEDYMLAHALPNLMFHATTTYNLLRGAGVTIGKQDFLGEQNWQPEK